MDLTEAEMRMILEKREKEDNALPKFTGTLKHDLVYLNISHAELRLDISEELNIHGYYVSQDVLAKIRKKLEDKINSFLKLEKGAGFDCYIDSGVESWYDSEGFGIEEMDSTWAKKNLEDIKAVKKKKKAKKLLDKE